MVLKWRFLRLKFVRKVNKCYSQLTAGKPFLKDSAKAQWDPLLNRMGQNGHNFVRDMSLLESQSKGCVNPTFNPAHKWIFAMYLLGCICTVGARARAHPKF